MNIAMYLIGKVAVCAHKVYTITAAFAKVESLKSCRRGLIVMVIFHLGFSLLFKNYFQV